MKMKEERVKKPRPAVSITGMIFAILAFLVSSGTFGMLYYLMFGAW